MITSRLFWKEQEIQGIFTRQLNHVKLHFLGFYDGAS